MKKLKFLFVVLAIIIGCSMFLGCTDTPQQENRSNVATINYATFDGYKGEEVILYDYEELSDFQEINATQAFGLTKMNTDPQYVKEGKGSMHVRVDGYAEMYHHPEKVNTAKQVIEMYPNWYFAQRGDFSDAVCFKLDAYNISDRDIEISLMFQTANGSVVIGPEIALKGEWNELVFELDREKMFYQGFGSVKRMYLAFEGRTLGQTSAELYIDSLRYVKTSSAATSMGYIPEFKDDILCDFEDKYFINTMLHTGFSYPSANAFNAPKFELNSDKTYVTKGDSSLKITRYLNSYQHSIHPVYAEITILSDEYLRTVDLSKYDKNNTIIAYDVYNKCSETVFIRMDFCDASGVAFVFTQDIEPESWTTIEIPMTNAYFNWEKLYTVRLTFYDWFGVEESILYVDNFRLVNINN